MASTNSKGWNETSFEGEMSRTAGSGFAINLLEANAQREAARTT